MASLTQTAIVTRKIIRWGIYGVIFLIAAQIVVGMVFGVFRHFFPEPPPEPTVLFGRLQPIPFPESKVDPSTLTFSVETPEGGLPKFVGTDKKPISQLKIYSMPREVPNLFSVQEGLNKGKLLGFENQGSEITETLYQFRHSSLPKTLEINVVSNVFSISYDLASDPTAIEAVPPSPEIAAAQIRAYLTSAQLLPTDLTGPVSHEFLRVEQGRLVPALSLSEAHLVKVNLTRVAYDDLPALGGETHESNVWFLISGSKTPDKKIVAGEFHYFPIDTELFSTYPIKTAGEAFADLQNGNAFVIKSPSEGNIAIRRVYLAYYDPASASEFFQPIIVFEGDDFIAYVPAVTAEYYGE